MCEKGENVESAYYLLNYCNRKDIIVDDEHVAPLWRYLYTQFMTSDFALKVLDDAKKLSYNSLIGI